jgi:hypothetical protein
VAFHNFRDVAPVVNLPPAAPEPEQPFVGLCVDCRILLLQDDTIATNTVVKLHPLKITQFQLDLGQPRILVEMRGNKRRRTIRVVVPDNTCPHDYVRATDETRRYLKVFTPRTRLTIRGITEEEARNVIMPEEEKYALPDAPVTNTTGHSSVMVEYMLYNKYVNDVVE